MTSGSEIVVLDTSVVSILFNKADAVRCAYYQERLAGRRGLISFQTLEELLFGLHCSGWGGPNAALQGAHRQVRGRVARA